MNENDSQAPQQDYMLGNSLYDFVKKLVQIILPALSSLYFGLAQIWGMPDPEKVVGTIALFATFLGALLVLSTRSYESSEAKYDGAMRYHLSDEGKTIWSLEYRGNPDEILHKDEIVFKVKLDPE